MVSIQAQEPDAPHDATTAETREKAYRLSPGDLIDLAVFDAPEFAASQRLDASGIIHIPLLGEVDINQCSVREAQRRIAVAFVDAGLLVRPAVTITVREFALRQVFVFGQVANPGPVRVPPEKDEIDLVEIISMSGGFTRIAKKKVVRITRVGPGAKPETQTVNVDAMIDGRGGLSAARVFVRPGDVINVEEAVM